MPVATAVADDASSPVTIWYPSQKYLATRERAQGLEPRARQMQYEHGSYRNPRPPKTHRILSCTPASDATPDESIHARNVMFPSFAITYAFCCPAVTDAAAVQSSPDSVRKAIPATLIRTVARVCNKKKTKKEEKPRDESRENYDGCS
jgi:hypothetical protein